jgi:hypothetical protein
MLEFGVKFSDELVLRCDLFLVIFDLLLMFLVVLQFLLI